MSPYLIPTLHPAHVLRGAPMTNIIAMDLAKAIRVSQEGPTQIENIVVAHPASPIGMDASVRCVLQWMDRWQQARVPVAVDVETSGLEYIDCKLYSIALAGADGCNTAVAFTLEDFHTLTWTAEAALVRKLREVLQDPLVPKVYHNAPFDMAVLKRKGFELRGQVMDTQGLAHLVQPDIPKDLGWVGHTYLDVEPWKLNHEGKKQAFTSDVLELLVYNAKDALNTIKVLVPLLNDIAERGMSQELIQYQCAFSQLATRMELRGIPVNMRKRKARGEEILRECDGLLHGMREYLNWPDFNPRRRVHAMEALYGSKYLGLTPTKYTPAVHDPSVSYKAVIDHLEHPFVKGFVDWVELMDAYATQFRDVDERGKVGGFFKAIRWDGVSEHGRLYPKQNPTGQKGSRFSTSPNVQNIKLKWRDTYEAPPGYVIVGGDKDQLELRIIACRAGVGELIVELRKPDADPHTLACVIVYGDEFESRAAEDRKNMRDMVKNVQYAAIYVAGDKTIYNTLREKKQLDSAIRAALTLPVVTRINKSLVGRYVQIPAYHDENFRLAQTQGYNECPPFGRRRYFPVQPPPFTEVSNWNTQTEGSDHVGEEMVLMQDEFDRHPEWDACMIQHGHDSFAAECKEQYAEQVKGVADEIFGCTPIEGPSGVVNLTAKTSIGKTLLDVK